MLKELGGSDVKTIDLKLVEHVGSLSNKKFYILECDIHYINTPYLSTSKFIKLYQSLKWAVKAFNKLTYDDIFKK